jgi:hypothetical protein
VRKYIAALGVVLMLAGAAVGKTKAARISSADTAKRQTAIQNTTIIPGRSIGLIRLGMGMDEVNSILGTPDFNYSEGSGAYSSTTWKYISINLMMMFDGGAAPTVTSITATGWSHGAHKMGDIYWTKNIETPVVNYSTNTGVTLGSTSFSAIRAYAGRNYEDSKVWVTFKDLGLTLLISMDHMVYGITVAAPQ